MFSARWSHVLRSVVTCSPLGDHTVSPVTGCDTISTETAGAGRCSPLAVDRSGREIRCERCRRQFLLGHRTIGAVRSRPTLCGCSVWTNGSVIYGSFSVKRYLPVENFPVLALSSINAPQGTPPKMCSVSVNHPYLPSDFGFAISVLLTMPLYASDVVR